MSKVRKHAITPQIRNYLLLISVPTVLIGLLAAAVFLPRFFANPQYDFLYSECPTYACSDEFAVINNTVVKQENINYDFGYNESLELYYYDISEGTSRSISLDEARELQINKSNISKDGYEFELRDVTRTPTNAPRWSLRNGLLVKPLNITTARNYTTDGVTFVGWVDEK